MALSFSKSRMTLLAAWVIVSIFYAYQYILRVLPNIMLTDIMQQFGVNAAEFGQFSGVYYLGYSFIHLPIGILFDRFGPKKVMTACILCTLVGLLPLLFAEKWIYPVLGRFLIGIGSSAAILGVFKIVRMTFAEKRFSIMLSLSVSIGLIGAIYGGGPINYMKEVFGYHAVIQILSCAGLILATVTYWLIPSTKTESQGTVLSDIKEVLSNKKVLGLCLCAGLMVGPVEGFADAWGAPFLQQTYGFDKTFAASLSSVIFIGMCFGAPLLSFIASKVGYLKTVAVTGAIMGTSFFALLATFFRPAFLPVNFAIVGVCCAYQILAIYKASTYVREQVAGLTTAMANMIIMIFGYVFHMLIGWTVNAKGGLMDPYAIKYGIAVIPFAICVGTCGFIYLLALEKKGQKITA